MAKSRNQTSKLNLIKEALEAQGKTQAWLAEELDIEFRTVNRYINNHRQPSLERLFEIAKAIKINVKDLINS